ncbi:hypothetical protein J6590_001420 [Homalodisca vitripennis]|nr:hypothetical protein J6590_001420 [Homalodisca vitripennis]
MVAVVKLMYLVLVIALKVMRDQQHVKEGCNGVGIDTPRYTTSKHQQLYSCNQPQSSSALGFQASESLASSYILVLPAPAPPV